jgi:hypothetical protein
LKHAEHVHVIYCYESFSNAQMIWFPGMLRYDHIIGSLYSIEVDRDGKKINISDRYRQEGDTTFNRKYWKL